MVAYDYLLVEQNFGAAFLCNLNHFIHALARFFLCMVSPRRCESLVIIVPSFHSQNKTQNARWPLDKENQTCLIGRKPSQMSKLDLLQSVMIFPFVTMKLKGRDRKYAAFD